MKNNKNKTSQPHHISNLITPQERVGFFRARSFQRCILALCVYIASISTLVAAQESTATMTVEEMEARLSDTPIFLNMDTDAVEEIFEAGQVNGNHPNVFTTVGDSNTTNGDFLRPIGLSNSPCDLGEYEYLRETIDYFSVPPTENDRNSFTRESIAADRGFSTYSALDPFWADSDLCLPNESPLVCEYRVTEPSISLIMLGQIDINYAGTSIASYRANMEEIITTSIEHGVIPVLSTIVFLPERDVYPLSLQYNMVILDLAEEYQIPLINLWLAVQPLPNVGIGPDRSHLRAEVGRFCSFDGAEQELGGTLRNLLNLQALHLIQTNILLQTEEPES